jgi:hypothetical protein
MIGQQQPVPVHSLTEASLYVMLVACDECGGSVWPRLAEGTGPDETRTLTVPITCHSCGRSECIRFDVTRIDPPECRGGLQAWVEELQGGQTPPINPTQEPSRAIDVAGWLMVHAMLSDANRALTLLDTADRGLLRSMQMQAGECIDEALKFYDLDNDLPPEDAFFTEAGRRQFREHPELFLRQRLVSLRMKMPVNQRTSQE